MKKITKRLLEAYGNYLSEAEKAAATAEKYLKDVREFALWIGDRTVEKGDVLAYKAMLCERYAPASVNAAISSLNSFFRFCAWHELRVRSLKIQRRIFIKEERELSRAEYGRLLRAASEKGNERLSLLMQTVGSTGIRVSELRYITVEAVARGYAEISCKGKHRTVFLPKGLCRVLLSYLKKSGIQSGAVFVTKSGRPLDRSNIWSDMKRLCKSAGVSESKVFPHNLRHLFARTYYSLQKDIVRLADLLGHSSVNTTRIYTMESGTVHRRQLEKLGLLLC